MEDRHPPPERQAPGAFTAAELEHLDLGEDPPPATEPRPIGDAELLRLLDEAGFDMVEGNGPFLSVARKGGRNGYTSVYRFQDLEECRRAYLWAHQWYGSAAFLAATGEHAQRPHEGCGWWCLPPWREDGMRRPKAWGGRYDPKRRAAYFAKKFDAEPDVDRAVRAILKRIRECPDCRAEAGESHVEKLERHERRAAEDRLPMSVLASMPLDQLM